MVYAVQAQVGFRNTSRRDTVMQTVQTRLQTEITWGTVITRAVNPGGPGPGAVTNPTMLVEVRFSEAAARDAFWNDVVAYMGGGVNGPTTGSSIWKHDCPHDGGAAPCVISQRQDY